MPFEFSCPSCKKRLRAPDKANGQKKKCPNCGTSIQITTPNRDRPATPKPPVEDELPIPFDFEAPIERPIQETEPAAVVEEAQTSCSYCQAKTVATAKFCPSCGKKLPSPAEAALIQRAQQSANNGCTIGCLSIIGLVTLMSILTPKNNDSDTGNGAVVQSSPWDASVRQVDDWLKNSVKDPDSLQYIEWSPVSQQANGEFMVRVKYRAKNSFGGYVVENKLFFLSSSGTVLRSKDF